MARPTLKDWALRSSALDAATGRPSNDVAPALTADERAMLKVLIGPKMSDTKRAQAAGLDIEAARRAAWSLREKLKVAPGETLKDAAKRLRLT